ncbi:MAG TPA: Rieske 2Fe-2S domain-containing protein [Terriglobales bacterium]|nr:Rieske 2Fe-2S domain-containing protein [Terriglobales bacterium]
MAEQNKERVQTEANPAIDRREFFVRVGLTSMGIAAVGTTVFGYQFLSPNVLYEPSPVVNMGKPESYQLDSVTLDVEARIFVVHATEGFFAVNAVCTHLGCLTAWKPEIDTIACPCHGSKFTREGVKKEGPAPKPLPWLRMWLSEDGELMVDRSDEIRPQQFVRV